MITALLSRDCSTPINRLQHSYQEIAALLSRDRSTPVKRLQQNITKMVEYLNFFLLCILLALIFYLYIRAKRYINLLKMAEDNLIFSGYDPPQLDTKRQKLLECVLTRNSKLYLGKVHTEDQIKNLVMKKWINFLTIMKLSSQVRW